MTKREITRDFCVQGKPVCGDTLMFVCPDGTPPLEPNKTVFSVFDWGGVVKRVLNRKLSKPTVAAAAKEHALTGVSKIASWATSEEVVADLKCAPVQKVTENFAARKPWTISWSNVCDYVDYSDFHLMARSCSVCGDTIHFGYSMNWVTVVLGVNIIVFRGPQNADFRASIIEASNKSVQKCCQEFGWDQHLRSPPPTNPINTTSTYGLEHLHRAKWSDYFFELEHRAKAHARLPTWSTPRGRLCRQRVEACWPLLGRAIPTFTSKKARH